MGGLRGPRPGLVALATVLLTLGAGILASSPVSAQDEAVSVGSLTLPVGEEGLVEVEVLEIGAPGLGAWLVDVVYDPNVVSLLSCTAVQELGICNAAFAEDTIRFAGSNETGLQGDTTLASIVFVCESEGVSRLSLGVLTLADIDFQDIDATVMDGGIICGTPDLVGDANCDGIVNSVDAALILQMDAALIASLPCQDFADVNSDAAVNSVDATLVLQFDAGLIDSLPPSQATLPVS